MSMTNDYIKKCDNIFCEIIVNRPNRFCALCRCRVPSCKLGALVGLNFCADHRTIALLTMYQRGIGPFDGCISSGGEDDGGWVG